MAAILSDEEIQDLGEAIRKHEKRLSSLAEIAQFAVYGFVLSAFARPFARWSELNKEQKYLIKLKTERILEDPGLDYASAHADWVRYQIDYGWTPGPVEDIELKESPYLIPYLELSTLERTKRVIFTNVVVTASKFL